ncbi:hypothetical protein BAE44_0011729 [Dichanthelium oligosanthes]|uniref:F-box domain-containing protein n=1 Tax=Dichanthelium oligosanthes TaxID=888268 RepID=A0A1E5VQ50_9POAL|nr:hypothetical protein BAE44_0011729 [Dichanthelium oligosanthes]
MTATQAEEEASTCTSVQLNDDVVTEILLRLPSTSVLRSRAVSKAWRAITTRPDFLAAHARRRPLELIVEAAAGALHTVPLGSHDKAKRRCLHPGGYPADCWLVASCDGLLLLEIRAHAQIGCIERLLVCNPVTRQWTPTVPPRSDMLTRFCGFYLHRPSGEHRLLFLANDHEYGGFGRSASHHVRSLEAGETRRLGPAARAVHMFDVAPNAFGHRGNLHWLAEKADDEIVVFDTVEETFRRMSRPPVGGGYDAHHKLFLLETDGMLAAAAVRGRSVDLWVMEGYSNDQSWTRRHRIGLPPPLRHVSWVMVGPTPNAILVGRFLDNAAVLCDLTEKVLKRIQLSRAEDLTAHVFRDSLQRHAFFDLQQEQS